MSDKKREPASTTDTGELDNYANDLPFVFADDVSTANTDDYTSKLGKIISSISNTTTRAVVGQMNSKYSDPVYLQTATYDSILEDVTREYIDAAKRLGQTDARIITCELMEVTNHVLRALKLSKGNNDIKALKCLSPAQIGEVLIRIHNVVKLSLDDTDDESERATVLAAYMESGTREGLYYYDVSNTEIKKLISRYSFSAKKSDQNEVVNYLQIHAPLRKANSDGNLIAVSNGIFDFKNKVLMSFSPDYVFLRKLKVGYNAGAVNVVIHNDGDGTDWDIESWLGDMSDDPEIVDLLWQVMSASIRPNVPFNKAIFFYSRKGNNGKGTICQLIRNLWGAENCCSLSVADFDKDFMLTPLLNASVVLGDENPVGFNIDNADKFKLCVTHDPIEVNIKFQQPRKYRFRGLIIECVNEILRLKDKTGSMARRELIISFEKSFTGKERKYIKSDYIARKDVLEYVLYRALNMNFYSFSEPQACKEALNDQREMNDPIRQFWTELRDCFVWDLLPRDFLYELYKSWIRKNIPNCPIKGKNSFMMELADIVSDDAGWQYSRTQVRVTKHMMNTPEPLIAEFNLDDWKNPNYMGGDLSRICLPELKDKYTGIVRV